MHAKSSFSRERKKWFNINFILKFAADQCGMDEPLNDIEGQLDKVENDKGTHSE